MALSSSLRCIWITRRLRPRLPAVSTLTPLGTALILAVLFEAGWEVLENSNIIIDRYRKTMAESYDGDSVVNSMSDISFAIIAFFLASRLPVWLTVSLALLMEIVVGCCIRTISR